MWVVYVTVVVYCFACGYWFAGVICFCVYCWCVELLVYFVYLACVCFLIWRFCFVALLYYCVFNSVVMEVHILNLFVFFVYLLVLVLVAVWWFYL